MATVKGTAKVDSFTVNASSVIVVTGKKSSTKKISKNGKNKIYGAGANDNFTIKGGKKNYIYGDAGNDTITVTSKIGTGNKIYGDDAKNKVSGNDTFNINGGNNNYFYGGKGNDTFNINGGSGTILDGGAGKDTFVFGKKKATATIKNYAAGQDTLKVNKGIITSTTAKGKDVTFKAGNASVTLTGSLAKSVSIKDSRGGYTISNTTITLGKDFTGTMDTTKYLSTIKAIDGRAATKAVNITGNAQANPIYTGKANGTVKGGAGADKITIGSATQNVDGGADGDTITINGGNRHVLRGGTGSDTYVINTSLVKNSKLTINQSDYKSKDTDTLQLAKVDIKDIDFTLKNGTLTITHVSGGMVTVSGWDKNPLNKIQFAGNKSVTGSVINQYFKNSGHVIAISKSGTYEGTGMKDVFRFSGSDWNAVITGVTSKDRLDFSQYSNGDYDIGDYYREGNDLHFTYLQYDNSFEDGERLVGTITIKNYFASDDNNLALSIYDHKQGAIRLLTLKAGKNGSEGDDFILAMQENSTLNGGAGNDIIYGTYGNDTLYGGVGNDLIDSGEGDDTLGGGIGDDVLIGGNGKDTFVYANGDGTDTIKNYTAGQDTLSISSGSISKTVISGKNVVFTVGKGTVTVENASEKAISLKDSRGSYTVSNAAITLGEVFTGTMDTSKFLSTVITIDGRAATGSVDITGNANNNYIYASKGGGTIQGGSGDDTIYGGAGKDTFVYATGNGNDVIADYTEGEDTLKITGAAITGTRVSGDDIVVSVANGQGSITLKGAAEKTIRIHDNNGTYTMSGTDISLEEDFIGTLDASAYLPTISMIDGRNAEGSVNIIGNSQNNVIYAGKGGGTIKSGYGKNTIYFGTGKDVFIYENGNNTIYNYMSDSDTIALSSATLQNSVVLGNDTLLTLSNGGHITLKNVTNKSITYTDLAGNLQSIITGTNADNSFDLSFSKNNSYTVYSKSGNDSINLFESNGNNIVYGDDGNDKIYLDYSTGNNTIYGGRDDDSIYLTESSGNNIVYGGDGNDTIRFDNSTGNNTIYGDEGNDSIYLGTYSGNNIIYGGDGNDSIYGLNETDTYVYTNGNDEIDPLLDSINIQLSTELNHYQISEKGKIILYLANGKHIEINTSGMINKVADVYLFYPNNQTIYLKGPNKINGTEDDDIIYGTEEDNIIHGDCGDDIIFSGNGNNWIFTGTGDDIVHTGNGNNTISGSGDNIIFLGNGKNNIGYNGGDDIVYGYKEGIDTFNLSSFFEFENSFIFGNDIIIETKYKEYDADECCWKDVSHCITIKDGKGKRISYKDDSNIEYIIKPSDSTINDTYLLSKGFINNTIQYLGDGKHSVGEQVYDNDIVTDDSIIAGNGNDIIYRDETTRSDINIINGGNGDDIIYVSENAYTAKGGNGNDIIYGNKAFNEYGHYSIYGGNGDDTIYGGKYTSYIYGGNGNDMIYSNSVNDNLCEIYGGNGDDTINCNCEEQVVYGGLGQDSFIFTFQSGYKTIIKDYDAEQDLLIINNYKRISNVSADNNDVVLVREERLNATKTIYYSIILENSISQAINVKDSGGSYVLSGLNSDNPTATLDKDYKGTFELKGLVKTINAEHVLNGVNFNLNSEDGTSMLGETIICGIGDDKIQSGPGDNIIYCGDGNDEVTIMGNGNNIVHGDSGDDIIYCRSGNDTIYGGDGNDTIYGGDGNDTIYGGNGNDTIHSGRGIDTICFSYYDKGDKVIKDYSPQSHYDDIAYYNTDGDLIKLIDFPKDYYIKSENVSVVGDDVLLNLTDNASILFEGYKGKLITYLNGNTGHAYRFS